MTTIPLRSAVAQSTAPEQPRTLRAPSRRRRPRRSQRRPPCRKHFARRTPPSPKSIAPVGLHWNLPCNGTRERQGKCRRLAGSRLGYTQKVLSTRQVGDPHELDGSGSCATHLSVRGETSRRSSGSRSHSGSMDFSCWQRTQPSDHARSPGAGHRALHGNSSANQARTVRDSRCERTRRPRRQSRSYLSSRETVTQSHFIRRYSSAAKQALCRQPRFLGDSRRC